MPRRIRRPADKQEVFKVLTEGDGAVFKTYKDLMICAACVGYAHKQRQPFEKTLEAIHWHTFSGPTDAAIVNAIALSETGDLEILLNEEEAYDQRFTIFEEYANAGLEIMQQRILAVGGPLDSMVDFIFEYAPDRKASPEMTILQKLAKQVRE